MQQLHIYRDHDFDIKFTGKLISKISSKNAEISLFLSDKNYYITQRKDADKCEAHICKSIDEIIHFLGYDKLSKALYANADIKYWIEV